MACAIKDGEFGNLNIGLKCHCLAGISVYVLRESKGVPWPAEAQARLAVEHTYRSRVEA